MSELQDAYRIDHVIVWLGNLEQAKSDLSARVGVVPGWPATLHGFGAHMVRVMLEASFVEFVTAANPDETRSNRYGRMLIERWQRCGDGPLVYVLRTPTMEKVLLHCKSGGGLCEAVMIGGVGAPWLGVFMPGTEPVFLDPRLPKLFLPRATPYFPADDHAIGARALGGVIVAVEDLDEALKLYYTQLALEPELVERADGTRSATFRIDRGRQRLVVVEGSTGTPVRAHVEEKGEGIFGVILSVRDVAHATRELASRGMRMTKLAWLRGQPATDPSAAAGTRFVLEGADLWPATS